LSQAIELNSNRVFQESNISGYDYLHSIVHLPFYLQNSSLRKVKMAQAAAKLIFHRAMPSAAVLPEPMMTDDDVSSPTVAFFFFNGDYLKATRALISRNRGCQGGPLRSLA
jgi:hypothetical protein